ncbi:MAG: hypothetical protein NXI28_26355 [bacterium]|nr:hypothetical protein [bacterium]
MISFPAIAREAKAICFSVAALAFLVAIAHLLVPLGITVPDRPSLLLTVLGIAIFFCLTPLEPKTSRLVPLRSLSLLLIGAGILARILPKISFISSGFELLAHTGTAERSFAVSTVLLLIGFVFLTVYCMVFLLNRRRESANHPDTQERDSDRIGS